MKRDIIVVGKTHKFDKACIGALDLNTGEALRLHTRTGGEFAHDISVSVGDVYAVEGEVGTNLVPPHVENFNVLQSSGVVRQETNVESIIVRLSPIAIGSPDSLYEGALSTTHNGSLRARKSQIPSFSTGFWRPDIDLVLERDNQQRNYYWYRGNGHRARLKYVGYQDAVEIIKSGTLVRVSLSTWFGPGGSEPCCWGQLSGWY